MRRWYRVATMACLLLVVWAWGVCLAATKGVGGVRPRMLGPVRYKGSYALVIGASRYRAGWPRLENVPAEVQQVAQALRKKGFQVRVVLDPDAEELRRAFEKFIDDYGFDEGNRLLFYFSGHGYSRKGGRKGYLVPVDAPDPQRDEKGFLRKALCMDQVMAWAREMEAHHALFLFDSCFSGTVFKAKARPVPQHISALTAKPVRQFITAGAADETVPARSVFTPLFLRGIRGEADLVRDGYVTGTELGLFLQEKVPSYGTGQTPQYGKIKDPELDEGDFVFACAVPPGEPVPPPPPGEEGGAVPQVEFGDIEKWGRWQKAMRRAWAKARALEQKGEVDASAKAAAWGRVLKAFSADNPLSGEDEKLRQQGRTRLAYWRRQAKAEAEKRKETAGWPKRIRNRIGMEFVLIPAGSFMMGSKYSPEETARRFGGKVKWYKDEHPRHRVEITKPFYMQVTEVTQGQWRSVMGSNPSWSKRCGDDCPVEGVSWDDAQEFIRRLNRIEGRDIYRLPTEAEWEYACRAGSSSAYYFGDDAGRLGEYAWYDANSGYKTHSVKGKRPNAWGLYDMHGNVWEWCQDWYGKGYYSVSPRRDPQGPNSGKYRVVRGGSWGHDAGALRSARRIGDAPVTRDINLGFRVARITP